MRVFQPRRSQEKNSGNTPETPGQMGQNQGEGGFVPFVPEVSSVSEKKLDAEPEPQNLGTERPEPRDTVIHRQPPAATDPNKPAAIRTMPRPLERLLENLRAVHRQLEDDRAQGFILESIDLGVPSKLTICGIHYQALGRAIRSALERTPNAERVIVWTVQPDGWEVTCAQYSDLEPRAKRVQA